MTSGFLHGAYKLEHCLEIVNNKLIHGDIALTDYTEESFTKYMTSVFTNSNVYDNGKMKSMNGKGIARVVTGGNQTPSTSEFLTVTIDGSFGLNNSNNGTDKVTSSDIINMFRMTNYLAC